MTSIHTTEAPGFFVGTGANILEANKSLPSSQFDARNLTSTRYVEIGITFPDPVTSVTAEKISRSADLSSLAQEMYYDKSLMYRYSTFGLDSFIISRDSSFNEADRQPLAINIPQLSSQTESRYTFLLAVDNNILPSSSSTTIIGPLPQNLTIEFGCLNVNPLDSKLYAPNTPRTDPFVMASQQLKTVLVRFYVKTVFEPNFIAYIGIQNASLAASVSSSYSVNEPSSRTGGELRQKELAAPASDQAVAKASLAPESLAPASLAPESYAPVPPSLAPESEAGGRRNVEDYLKGRSVYYYGHPESSSVKQRRTRVPKALVRAPPDYDSSVMSFTQQSASLPLGSGDIIEETRNE